MSNIKSDFLKISFQNKIHFGYCYFERESKCQNLNIYNGEWMLSESNESSSQDSTHLYRFKVIESVKWATLTMKCRCCMSMLCTIESKSEAEMECCATKPAVNFMIDR